jgi:photosystem II stability/assembly factor-like uncharacterized protein
MKQLILIILLGNAIFSLAQNPVNPTTGESRKTSIAWNKQAVPYLSNVTAKNIGPSIMSGRISDIEVNEENTSEFYVSYASGGLWYTNNNGITFEPIFDKEVVMTIGAFDIHWPTRTIYIGTGESISSRSSYSGNGIYKSVDQGKNWKHIGLDESHHIGEVLVNPKDPNHVVVSALGHLYSENVERGIFVSKDGGETWTHGQKGGDGNTGSIEMIADKDNFNILYATMWHRTRRAWNFIESGNTSMIVKSLDGGLSWSEISKEGSGFPKSDGTGRIGLSMSKVEGKNYLFAIVDNFDLKDKKKEVEEPKPIDEKKILAMTKQQFDMLKDEDLQEYLDEHNFPEKFDAKKIKSMVKTDKLTMQKLVDFSDDSHIEKIDGEIKGAEVYLSTNEGSTWKKTHEDYIDGLFSTYGYVFAEIIAVHDDPKILYALGVPIIKSEDGGKTWINVEADNQHADHHCLWINPKNRQHLINGNDGGLNISYDGGKNWNKCNMPAVAQFYSINVDYEEPYNVYGGLQDNGVWYGKNTYEYSNEWMATGQYPYKSIGGGDGMQVQIDKRDNNTVYTGSQFGYYNRINKKTGDRKFITPQHELGSKPYRWNWQTPILLSPHNQDILYMGANKLLRSMDKGETFKAISDDLTGGGKKGDVPYGTLTTIDESTLQFGLIYTGSDDGQVYRTDNGGRSWVNLNEGLPKDLWISRIIASKNSESRVYVSLSGFRWDHFSPYLFMSDDYGKTWVDISQGLPVEPINVVREDHEVEDLLYVGTDHGLYVSMDRGKSFMPFASTELPKVAVHDLVIQTKANHLIVGTHGRSLYRIDLAPLKKINEVIAQDLKLIDIKNLRYSERWGSRRNAFTPPSEPKINFDLFSKAKGDGILQLLTKEDKVLFEEKLVIKEGLASYSQGINIKQDMNKELEKMLPKDAKIKEVKKADNGKIYPIVGEHKVRIKINGKTTDATLKVTNK